MRFVTGVVLALLLAGCASDGSVPPDIMATPYSPTLREPAGVVAEVAKDSPYRGTIAVGEVTNREGDATAVEKFFWRQTTSADLKEVLTQSLANYGLLAANPETARYTLTAEIVFQDTEGITAFSRQNITVAYRMVERASGDKALSAQFKTWDNTSTSLQSGPERASYYGGEGLKQLKVELARRQNVAKLIERLLGL